MSVQSVNNKKKLLNNNKHYYDKNNNNFNLLLNSGYNIMNNYKLNNHILPNKY